MAKASTAYLHDRPAFMSPPETTQGGVKSAHGCDWALFRSFWTDEHENVKNWSADLIRTGNTRSSQSITLSSSQVVKEPLEGNVCAWVQILSCLFPSCYSTRCSLLVG